MTYPLTKGIMDCVRDAIDAKERERAYALLDAARAGIEQLEDMRSYAEQLADAAHDVRTWCSYGLHQHPSLDAALKRLCDALANDQTGSAKAAGAPGAESTAAPTNTRTEIARDPNRARPECPMGPQPCHNPVCRDRCNLIDMDDLRHQSGTKSVAPIDRDIVSRAAEDANRAFGQWMPDAWLRLFENAYDDWARSDQPGAREEFQVRTERSDGRECLYPDLCENGCWLAARKTHGRELSQVVRQSNGADAIAAERSRQMDVEKWNPEHDDDHDNASLTHAAICYARLATFQIEDKPYAPILRAGAPIDWPWTPDSYKPKDQRRNLVRAGALIAAEIDRLDRIASRTVADNKQEGGNG